jgi:hypothetical protein
LPLLGSGSTTFSGDSAIGSITEIYEALILGTARGYAVASSETFHINRVKHLIAKYQKNSELAVSSDEKAKLSQVALELNDYYLAPNASGERLLKDSS